jgi:hypothetical protein
MNLLEDKLSDLRRHMPEMPVDLRDRCLSTAPRSRRIVRHSLLPRLAVIALIVAGLILWPKHPTKVVNLGMAAYAETMQAMATVPYWHFITSDHNEMWFDRTQGSAMQLSVGKYMIDQPDGDHWDIWKAGKDLRAEVYHYPAARWTQTADRLSAIVTNPSMTNSPLPVSRVDTSTGAWSGRPVDVITVDFTGSSHNQRRVIDVDPTSHRILDQRWFDHQANGAYKLSVEMRFDYKTMPLAEIFSPDRFLKQGYHRYDCWVDPKRHVLLDKDGKVIGKI